MESSQNKIAILINNLAAGGCERTAAFLLNNFSKNENVHLIMFSDIIHYTIPTNTIKWIIKAELTGPKRFGYFLTIPLAAKKIRRYLEKNKIDVLITFNHLPAGIGCRLKKSGWPGLLLLNEQIHCSEYLKNIPDVIRRIMKRKEIVNYYPYADKIITNAKGIKTDLEEHFAISPEKITVIGNPVDFSFINKQKNIGLEEISRDTNEFIFVHVGRYEPQKNHTLLINAFEKANLSNTKLWLIGHGSGYDNIKDLIHQKKLQEKIIQWGLQQNPFKFLEKADAFVLSSDYEGFPNVLLEAMACRLPVVSTNCNSGPAEILSGNDFPSQNIPPDSIFIGEYGILCPVGNTHLLAEAMSCIYSEKELRENLSTAALKIIQEYDSKHIFALFNTLVKKEKLIKDSI